MFGRKKKPKLTRKPAKVHRPGRLLLWWKSISPQRRKVAGQVLGWSVLIVVAAGAVIMALRAMERQVLTVQTPNPTSFQLRIAHPPEWMPGSLQRRIEAALTPRRRNTHDPQLPEKVYQLAMANPWVRSVQKVRRCRSNNPDPAILELDADFRRPLARLATETGFAYLDADGVRLPSEQIPHWVMRASRPNGTGRQVCFIDREEIPPGQHAKPIHYVLIDGVRRAAPPVGQKWPGEDLADGLRLVSMIVERPWANEVTVVDVRNHARRISRDEPQLRLFAQVSKGQATDIRFGRFPHEDADFVVAPARKISYIDEYVAGHGGRLAGINAYLDLRYDQLHVSIY